MVPPELLEIIWAGEVCRSEYFELGVTEGFKAGSCIGGVRSYILPFGKQTRKRKTTRFPSSFKRCEDKYPIGDKPFDELRTS